MASLWDDEHSNTSLYIATEVVKRLKSHKQKIFIAFFLPFLHTISSFFFLVEFPFSLYSLEIIIIDAFIIHFMATTTTTTTTSAIIINEWQIHDDDDDATNIMYQLYWMTLKLFFPQFKCLSVCVCVYTHIILLVIIPNDFHSLCRNVYNKKIFNELFINLWGKTNFTWKLRVICVKCSFYGYRKSQ